jgi:tetratricopeptide (TPR) repeat protein
MKGSGKICLLLMMVCCVGVHAGLLEDGWAAYNSGNYEEAYDLFSQAFRQDPGSVPVNFALAEAAYQKKKYSHAVFAYDRVLEAAPNHQKARYGKARTLLALKQTDEARAEFAALLGQDLKPEVRESIQNVIGQMDQSVDPWRFEGMASLAFFYDDNVNFGPAEEVINTLSGTLTLNNNSSQNDAWGIGLTVGGTASYDAGEQGGWCGIGGATLYTTVMDDASAQETLYTRAFAGARRVQQDALTELTVRYDRMYYGHDHLLDVYGADAAYLKALDRNNHFLGRLSLEHRDFDTDASNNGRDSIYTAAKASWKHFFANRRDRTELTAGLFCENAHLQANSNYGILLKAGGEKDLGHDVTGYASLQMKMTDYSDNMKGTFADDRGDRQYAWTLGARRPFAKDWTVDLQYRYTRNDSNLGLYDYDRHLTALTITRKF